MVICARIFGVGIALAFLTSCGPLTTPEKGVQNCAPYQYGLSFAEYLGRGSSTRPMMSEEILNKFMRPMLQKPLVSLQSLRRERDEASAASEKLQLNILILSGGGQWGAYGAGFLNGWSNYERDFPSTSLFMKRSDVGVVTGISTGALQSTLAFAGINPAERARADASLRRYYTPKTDDAVLIVHNMLWSFLRRRNALGDPSPLVKSVEEMVHDYRDSVLDPLLDERELLVGIANAANGRLYVTDMRQALQDGRDDCYREFLLASAAVPFTFPPRFIDGDMYVDGGVRFGAFLPVFWNDLTSMFSLMEIEPDDIQVKIVAIINGSLTFSGDPACELEGRCEEVKNDMFGIAQRSVDIITDSVYNFSAYAIAEGAHRQGYSAEVKFAYIPPMVLSERQCIKKGHFNPTFMECLFEAGLEDGYAQRFRNPFNPH